MVSWTDKLISKCKSWADFQQCVASQNTTKAKGDLFERLTQLYLQTSPIYSSKLKHVWWCNNNELPDTVRRKLNLPKGDEGIDLICETFDGRYWSVQAKYRTDKDKRLTTGELAKFLSLSFVTSNSIDLGLIAHTSTKPVQKSELMGNTTELGLQNFLSIPSQQWQNIRALCLAKAPKPPVKHTPRPHQKTAIADAINHFKIKAEPRGKLIMPCGTGKSLIAYWIARKLEAHCTIIAVPSLALVKQSLADWTAEFLAEGIRPEWIAICSDDTVGQMRDADSTVATVYEAGIATTTDASEIAAFLKRKTALPKIIFTTYQSGPVLAQACREAKFTPDLLIADEAHKTVGSESKKSAALLSDETLQVGRRMFMTATERVVQGAKEEVVSMDDPQLYGETFHQMSFKAAIEAEIICDYKILTLFVPEKETAALLARQAEVIVQKANKTLETDAHNLAAGIAVQKAFHTYGIQKAISFHSSIQRAKGFIEHLSLFADAADKRIACSTVSSKLSAGQRTALLDTFAREDTSLISNARCLTEGIDIPAVDCVAFIDPKQSVVDIVQAAGRAMRKAKGKTHGYILIPLAVPDGISLEAFMEDSAFKTVTRVVTALSTQDERIVEELKLAQPKTDKDIIQIPQDIAAALNVDYAKFAEAISTRVWQSVGKANWRSFEEAREYVRGLGLGGQSEWRNWAKSNQKPADIPTTPDRTYKDKGWIGMGDWLGTGNIAPKHRVYRPFEEARDFVRNLGLSGELEWRKWRKSGQRPTDIPTNPNVTYKGKGWTGVGDWLGTGTPATKDIVYRSFEEAREYARSLGLNGDSEWREWVKSGQRPTDIPTAPERTYTGKGWIGMGDWLGTGNIAPKHRVYRPFVEAREYVRGLELSNGSEWEKWKKSAQKPADIPATPRYIYKDQGWVSMKDWLGTGKSRSR